MIKYHGVAQDLSGNALPGATAQVKNHLTGSNAPIYADDGVTPLGNPLTADSSGRFSFKSPSGLFDIIVVKDAYSAALTEVTIVEDPSLVYLVNGGPALVYGDLVYVSGDGEVSKGQSDGTLEEAGIIGVCMETLLAGGSTGRIRTIGFCDRDGAAGVLVYLSATGTMTETPPASGFAAIIGKQITTERMYVDVQFAVEQF